ncbi:MAG: FHA domain-containing protein [Anaerolineae bacterium]
MGNHDADRQPPLDQQEEDEEHKATILTDGSPEWEEYPVSYDTERVRIVPRVPDPPTWRIIFHTPVNPPSIIGLDVRQSLVIGRLDPEFEDRPDLDLTPHLGLDHGVSRRHAALVPALDGLYLVDLDSKNGTWINGLYAEPGERYLMAQGDNIEFGLLRLIVRSVTMLGRSR